MSHSEAPQSSDVSEASKRSPEENASKQSFRRKVWEYLQKNDLVNFPRPVYGRIPNFKGSEEAAAKLLELNEFKESKVIEVNPDKPQEPARILVLENQKQLYVPVPRLKEGLLKHVTVQEDASKNEIKQCVSRRGIENGRTIEIEDKLQVDMLVLGSVAVSEEGYRIGKGRGYADLEFAILQEMKAVSDQTVIVTMVHDSQVFDTIPRELFKDHDVPVDYILTPTQIIKVQNRLKRPPGIIWNVLSQRRVNLMPILQSLKEIHGRQGNDTTLNGEDTDIESYERRRFNPFRKFMRVRHRSEGKTSESQGEDAGSGENNRRQRFPRRRRFYRSSRAPRSQDPPTENGTIAGGENLQKAPDAAACRPQRPRKSRRNRPQIDFSLMVSNIEKNVRVRDLKNALNERGIKPNDITWRGYKGFCYLHYANPNSKSRKASAEPAPPIVVDNVIEILQNMKITPDSESSLSVKVMEPISRIETTDVTAV